MAPLRGPTVSRLQSVTPGFSGFGVQLKRQIAAAVPNSKAVISRAVTLVRRSSNQPGAGVTPPDNIPNNAVFALFGLIGAGFVLTSIWFFFWAKNGGFHFKQGDWEEYKSTVLRRKGPNGTTLSGGTRSTDLGGGSVVGRRHRKSRYGEVDTATSLGTESEMSRITTEKVETRSDKEKEKQKKKKKKKKKQSRSARGGIFEESVAADTVVSSSVIGDSVESGTVVSGDPEEEHPDDAIRAYRHEKPARVGGMNRAPEGSSFDGSNVDSQSALLSNRQHTPTNTPTKKSRKSNYSGAGSASPGIRKVESTSGKSSSYWESQSATDTQRSVADSQQSATDTQQSATDTRRSDRSDIDARIKAEARRLQEKGRAAVNRRDFSYTVGDDASLTTTTTTTTATALTAASSRADDRRSRRSSRPPPSVAGSDAFAPSDDVSVSGTKSYHHPMPELTLYAEEKRRARAGGYRRDRRDRDDLADSDLD